MSHNPLPIEIASWARMAKFQPVPHPKGDNLPNATRVHLEYDGETLEYVERDRATGEIVDVGVIECESRVDWSEAA